MKQTSKTALENAIETALLASGVPSPQTLIVIKPLVCAKSQCGTS